VAIRDPALCTDYAATLLGVIEQLNISAPSRILNVAFNQNGYDEHTLVELFNADTGSWMLLDPTFDLTARLAGKNAWATAEDISGSTRLMRFSDIEYVFLGDAGDLYARAYYLDYPLLYLNVYDASDAEAPSALQYLDQVS